MPGLFVYWSYTYIARIKSYDDIDIRRSPRNAAKIDRDPANHHILRPATVKLRKELLEFHCLISFGMILGYKATITLPGSGH